MKHLAFSLFVAGALALLRACQRTPPAPPPTHERDDAPRSGDSW